jgi:hypothetical protein
MHACSIGLLAASAKNGRPIDTVNRPSSQNAAPACGGSPQPVAIDSGSAAAAAISRPRCTTTGTVRLLIVIR